MKEKNLAAGAEARSTVTMRMPAKAAAHWALSASPAALYFVQTKTGGFPISDSQLEEVIHNATEHFDALTSVAPMTGDALYLEFGVGRDLARPLAIWSKGMRKQVLTDIQPLARIELINDAIWRMRARGETVPTPIVTFQGLQNFGIEYRIGPNNLDDRSVRYIVSHCVFEHVPARDILPILRECHRILADDGAVSFAIDYHDHYHYADSRISPVNFLKFSDFTWRLLNPPSHYQNRLRHEDYLRLFHEDGFTVVSEKRIDEPSLGTLAGWFVLKKQGSPSPPADNG